MTQGSSGADLFSSLLVSLVIADVFFALFPWVMVWDLQMPRREKLTIAGSFSLGLMYVLLFVATTMKR
jgi:cytochrome bd-type quinol oxidase subunit 2